MKVPPSAALTLFRQKQVVEVRARERVEKLRLGTARRSRPRRLFSKSHNYLAERRPSEGDGQAGEGLGGR
jgi:hypothetical protein